VKIVKKVNSSVFLWFLLLSNAEVVLQHFSLFWFHLLIPMLWLCWLKHLLLT